MSTDIARSIALHPRLSFHPASISRMDSIARYSVMLRCIKRRTIVLRTEARERK
ncbi:MAG: hypothetical protein J7642_15805 [Cyanobacteria bacterium SBC]|nr:hypothetical protein [Cyanobacteria bacterium SBC]